jgi:N utilization substance protein B
MFSRRLLRIKVFQTLYSHYKAYGRTYAATEKELLHSIEKTYQLYYLLILLIIDLADHAEARIEQARQKKIPSPEDLNPNTRFIDNRLIRQLRSNEGLLKYLRGTPLSWAPYPEIVRKLYHHVLEAEFYREYMKGDDESYRNDRKLLERIYLEIVIHYEDLYLNLEEQSIFWTDDVDFILKMIVKTLKSFREENPQGGSLLPMFKDREDLEYCKKLLRKTIQNEKDYLDLIKASTNNWELERIAFTDNLILQLAISEAVEFDSIPTKVTINEFIEIAKLYSTQKSSQFINGILDNIISGLKAEGRIRKTGRGLIGEV